MLTDELDVIFEPHRLMTLSDINAAEKAGDIFPIDSGITFNCSIVSQRVYALGTPLHF